MNIAAILAGGRGLRMGSSMPKQFMEIDGKPIIVHTIEKFQNHIQIDEIYIVCAPDHCSHMKELVDAYKFTKVKSILPGGADRQKSSFIAVEEVYKSHSPKDIILIHDAARPNINPEIISKNIAAASNIGACNTVIPSQDTILISDDSRTISEYTDRSRMYLVQTPQSFKLDVIYSAHIKCVDSLGITDDCSMVTETGGTVELVPGDKYNLKITTEEDLKLFSFLVKCGK